MKNKSLYTIFTTIIVVAAIVGIIYYINAQTTSPKSAKQTTASNSPSSQSSASINTAEDYGTIIYTQRTPEQTEIYKISFKDQKPAKIFTDKDEDEKIKFASDATYNGKVLAMMTSRQEEFIGNLYLIKTDGSGSKEKIAADFASTTSPIISPDGSKIAYTQFSNAEADYGFKLIVANYDNSSKREIVRDSSGLNIFCWSPDSKKIAFTKGSNQNGTEIKFINQEGNDESTLYKLDGSLISLDWGNNNRFVLASGPKQNKANEQVEIYSLENNKLSKLTNNSLFDFSPHFSKTSDLVSYISSKPTDQSINYTPGKLNIMKYSGDNPHEITDGNFIIGNF